MFEACNEELRRIERAVRHGAFYMSESLADYWPTNGNNELSERNISLHLSHSFAERGFRLYAEAHPDEGVNRRIDMLALDIERRVSVACEFKRLYSTGKLEEVLNDVQRLLEYRPRGACGDFKRYGLIAASTWHDGYAKWWSTMDGARPTEHDCWRRMEDHPLLNQTRYLFGSYVLRGYTPERSYDASWHYLLYGIFEIPA